MCIVTFYTHGLTANMNKIITFLRQAFILSVLTSLVACSGTEEKEDPFANWTAEDFYAEASQDLRLAEFEAAINKLETLEARFPFSKYATQAQLDVAYAYYKFDEPDSTISAVERFLRLHPRSPQRDYAIYLQGLANFYRGVGLLEIWFPRDLAQHDQKNLLQAMKDFSRLIKDHPNSIYAPDAYLRSIYLRNELAEAGVNVAQYYLEREAWIGAINRAQQVIQTFQTAPARDQALAIMKQAYEKLGMMDLAVDIQKIMDLNPARKPESLTDKEKENLVKRIDPKPPVI